MSYQEPTSHLSAPVAPASRPAYRGDSAARPKPKLVGHDSVLVAIQTQGRPIHVTLLSSGEELVGALIARDKYTLTVKVGNVRHVIYKHAIERFWAEEKQVANND